MKQSEERRSAQKRITSQILPLVIIINISIFIIFLFYPPLVFYGFLTSWTAGLLGIITGFALDRRIEQDRDEQTKKDFLALMRNELITIRGKIPPQTKTPLMLYPEVWDSFVSSGLMRLLKAEQVTKLSSVYKFVKGIQYEAEWVRTRVEEYETIPDSSKEEKEHSYRRYRNLYYTYITHGEQLTKEIDEILKETWLG